jgi:hypothetical protein
MLWYKITAEIEADRRKLVGPERDGFIAGCLYAASKLGPYHFQINQASPSPNPAANPIAPKYQIT